MDKPRNDVVVEAVVARLESAVEDVRQAIADMRAGPREAEHYER